MSVAGLRNELKKLRLQVEALRPQRDRVVFLDVEGLDTEDEAIARAISRGQVTEAGISRTTFVRWSFHHEAKARQREEAEYGPERRSDYDQPRYVPRGPDPVLEQVELGETEASKTFRRGIRYGNNARNGIV
jgi:hypothetical protein